MRNNALTCWCGTRVQPTRVRAETFALLRCPSCGCFRIDPPPITTDEQSGDFYTAYYAMRQLTRREGATGGGAGRHSRYWRVVDQVPTLGAPVRTVIDFGSGEGRLCFELSQSGCQDVVGVDISRARVARARGLYPGIRFYDRPMDQTDLPRGAADLCVMDNVIEHLTEPQVALESIQRYLKPFGRIVVITPNMESGHFRLLGRRWTPELAPHAHVFLFTAASLSRALVNAGFVVQTVGALHDDPYPIREWTRRLFSGDVKGALWRAHQELGRLYGRAIGAGSMLFAVAQVPARDLGRDARGWEAPTMTASATAARGARC
jgi:SAM-dependent methyltransferase